MLAASLTHALHDGYTDALYAFLPGWQAQFGLSYAALAVVRALYYGTMGGLQIPADRALRALSPRAALILSTGLAATGFAVMALPFGFAGLCVGLVVAGIGSSIQHPRGSMLVTDSYGKASRRPLGIYNFSGDLGKAALPALVAVLLPVLAWRPVLGLMAAGAVDHPSVQRGIDYLMATRPEGGLWHEDTYTAVGFPRVFYLRYHGYRAYFPLMALARFRNLKTGNSKLVMHGM